MDVAVEWTERIAQRLTPGQVDFAAETGLAYAVGGRRSLMLTAGQRHPWPDGHTTACDL
jgi:hypothetical protein